jgi:Zn-finger nucleic acid-binding protein
MRCPVDNETLVMADRGGVEIDYCPKCRGVWLDRGELDKIIERSANAAPAPAAARAAPVEQPVRHQAAPVYQPEPRAPQGYRDEDRRRHDDDDDYRQGHKKKRRESFLGELFDF